MPKKETVKAQPFLTGTHKVSFDSKKRISIPKQLKDSLFALNEGKNRIYLRIEKDKVQGLPIPTLQKFIKEFESLSILDAKTRKKMEQFGSSIYEISFKTDGRITTPDEITKKLKLKPNDDITIEGALDYFTFYKSKTKNKSNKTRR